MNDFFTMNGGSCIRLPILGEHCVKYRPEGWDISIIEIHDVDGKCIGMWTLR